MGAVAKEPELPCFYELLHRFSLLDSSASSRCDVQVSHSLQAFALHCILQVQTLALHFSVSSYKMRLTVSGQFAFVGLARLDRMAPFSAIARAVSGGVTLWKAVTHPTPTSSMKFSLGSTLPGWHVTCGMFPNLPCSFSSHVLISLHYSRDW